MNGAEHYRHAEELLRWAADVEPGDAARYHLAAAQVHATLALAAATARQPSTSSEAVPDTAAWLEATS